MLLADILTQPLMMDPMYVPRLVHEAAEQLRGVACEPLEPEPLEASYYAPGLTMSEEAKAGQSGFDQGSLIAVVPLAGVISRRDPLGVATLHLGRLLLRLDRDAAVGHIVLSVDSPGGEVSGTPETAQILYDIRKAGKTKTYAAVDPLMASAATYIATAAENVYAIPSAAVGSIGVINAYTDYSKMLEEAGIAVTVMRTPELKARFSSVEPLTAAMRSTIEVQLDKIYRQFVKDMARNRGTDVDTVTSKFGGGEVMDANEGVEAGLIDGIASLDEVIGGILSSQEEGKNRRHAAARRRLQIEIAK